jgi:hypothetical protein
MVRTRGACRRPASELLSLSQTRAAPPAVDPTELARSASQIAAFSKLIGANLNDRSSSFAKDYLVALVDEVRVEGKTATITGSNAALVEAVAGKKEGTAKVPSFMREWRARQDSNPRPLGS